jgi:hypothetical protein
VNYYSLPVDNIGKSIILGSTIGTIIGTIKIIGTINGTS